MSSVFPKMFGSNSGIKRYLTITQDALRQRPAGERTGTLLCRHGVRVPMRALLPVFISGKQSTGQYGDSAQAEPGTVVQSIHGQIFRWIIRQASPLSGLCPPL